MQLQSVHTIRQNNFATIPKQSGVYILWMMEKQAVQLLNQLPKVQIEKIQRQELDGESYLAVYTGIATKDLRGRAKWHLLPSVKHTQKSVASGYLSTLRQSLSALLGIGMTHSTAAVNALLDEYCYFAWEDEADFSAFETNELTTKYYPINIQNNKVVEKETIAALKALRKQFKK